jgi:mRNA-degrading endonuclease RelE of RelBE toxin-antitoxin system
MENFTGCQIPCLPHISEEKAEFDSQSFDKRFKRTFARPWNYFIKRYLKQISSFRNRLLANINHKGNRSLVNEENSTIIHLQTGDWVRVRSLKEIQNTLNSFNELKGCAFLEDMKQYCDTQQRVLKVMKRFLDERDYKVKKSKGIVLLDGIYCQGTPVFGRCDRSCLLFWREEWLEQIPEPSVSKS